MLSWLKKIASACWRPFSPYVPMNKGEIAAEGSLIGQDDALLWYRDLEKHSCGEISLAVVQANKVMEDHCQVENACNATFVGVYDGHGGPDASRFVSDHLISHLTELARENGRMSEGFILNAFSATENAMVEAVEKLFPFKPLSAVTGSCCLVGVIWKGMLYVANLGDSRAVLGCVDGSKRNLRFIGRSKKIIAQQLTIDHNANLEVVRQEVQSLHPDDSGVVVQRNGVWRIKGIIQVSRSIGDVYLKKPGLDPGPSYPRFNLPQPLRRAVLRSDPEIEIRILRPSDKFLIFASDGLWELLSNQKAVELVHNSPRVGIARRLIKLALETAAKRAKKSYDELKNVKGDRRQYYDDITVVVVFIDHEKLEDADSVPGQSLKGFNGHCSAFELQQGNDVNATTV